MNTINYEAGQKVDIDFTYVSGEIDMENDDGTMKTVTATGEAEILEVEDDIVVVELPDGLVTSFEKGFFEENVVAAEEEEEEEED